LLVESGSKSEPLTVAVFLIALPAAEPSTSPTTWIVLVAPLARAPTLQVIVGSAEASRPASSAR